MGKWEHRLSSLDPIERTAVCAKCGPVRVKSRGAGQWKCKEGDRARKPANWRRARYRKFLKGVCARCGFIPEDACQLDIHHLDENHANNAVENLQTLCANCHRLVTKLAENKKGPVVSDGAP